MVKQLTSASLSLEAQYVALSEVVKQKINVAETYEPYMTAATQILDYYEDKKSSANALISCSRRQARASSATELTVMPGEHRDEP